MTDRGPNSLPSIGFLTVEHHADHGLFGGYLVLNTLGRPVEFHCTAPVKPNRAQEILYGPTLEPYLYGEQIGRTLVEKSQAQPLWVCTDVQPVLAVRPFISTPVALIVEPDAANDHHSTLDERFELHGHQLTVAATHPDDRQSVLRHAQGQSPALDLAEPFGRIREAIIEAQRAAKAA